MMKLYSLFDENHILIGEDASSLEDGIRLLLEHFGTAVPTERREELVEDLLERERATPTILAEGICMPHQRLEWLHHFLLGMVIYNNPVPHIDANEKPIKVMFMILTPQHKNTMMLQTMAGLSRLLQSRETRRALPSLKAANRFIRLVEESGIDVKKTLIAADVMTPIKHTVTLDMNLFEAVDVLVVAPDEGVPVVNDQKRLVGEITSRELLQLGMPKYLDLLVNPAMLDNFEPFENFFRHENTMRVREICRRDVISVKPSAPIVQVTHMMMTRSKRRIYVVHDGELQGVILRKNIIAKVLHV